jgi:hypothetical protein
MLVGGFNGSEPSPTLAQFERYVSRGAIHYFLGRDGFPGQNGGSSSGRRILDWVEQNFTAETGGWPPVYDLTAPR